MFCKDGGPSGNHGTLAKHHPWVEIWEHMVEEVARMGQVLDLVVVVVKGGVGINDYNFTSNFRANCTPSIPEHSSRR
jgi:hypothetical protein